MHADALPHHSAPSRFCRVKAGLIWDRVGTSNMRPVMGFTLEIEAGTRAGVEV